MSLIVRELNCPNRTRTQLARVTEKCVQKIVINSAFGRLEQTWLAQGLFGFFFFPYFSVFLKQNKWKHALLVFFLKKIDK